MKNCSTIRIARTALLIVVLFVLRGVAGAEVTESSLQELEQQYEHYLELVPRPQEYEATTTFTVPLSGLKVGASPHVLFGYQGKVCHKAGKFRSEYETVDFGRGGQAFTEFVLENDKESIFPQGPYQLMVYEKDLSTLEQWRDSARPLYTHDPFDMTILFPGSTEPTTATLRTLTAKKHKVTKETTEEEVRYTLSATSAPGNATTTEFVYTKKGLLKSISLTPDKAPEPAIEASYEYTSRERGLYHPSKYELIRRGADGSAIMSERLEVGTINFDPQLDDALFTRESVFDRVMDRQFTAFVYSSTGIKTYRKRDGRLILMSESRFDPAAMARPRGPAPALPPLLKWVIGGATVLVMLIALVVIRRRIRQAREPIG